MNIGSLVTRHAQYRPDHVAVVVEKDRLTYQAFNKRVNRLANALYNLGIRKGDKVTTILSNCLELLDIYWATAKIGAVVVPMSNLLRGTGLTRLLNDSDTVLVITNAVFTEHLDPIKPNLPAIAADRYILTDADNMSGYQYYYTLTNAANETEPPYVEVADSAPYNIIYSSGTTGLPKGIIHTHYIRAMYATLFGAAYRILPESIILHTGSLVFNGAFLTLLPAFLHGATYILHKKFDPVHLIDTVAKEKVTHIKMVPSQIVAMLNAPNFSPEALQSLEMVGSVGAPLHRTHKEALIKHLPNRFYELYGVTEGFMTILDKNDVARKMDSVGAPTAFMEIKIVDENRQEVPPGTTGEIIGRGPVMMPGYYKRPDLTEKAIIDGWLYSGDLGYMDEDGFLYLVDRKKDMIISGGINVYPKDIEEIVIQHDAVREVAVFGIPHDKWGETPIAAVILHKSDTATAESIRNWVNDRIEARFQRLHDVLIMDEFPRSTAGKTLKRVMRETYWSDTDTKI